MSLDILTDEAFVMTRRVWWDTAWLNLDVCFIKRLEDVRIQIFTLSLGAMYMDIMSIF